MGGDLERIKYGNCYQFDVPDDRLDANETAQIIDALLFDLKRTPVGESFILDISIGPDLPDDASWEEFLQSRRQFHRAAFEKSDQKLAKDEVIDFLRQNFAHILSLPPPKLKRIK